MKKNKPQKMTPEDRSMLKEMRRRSWILFSNFNMANYQGTGYSNAMLPAIRRFYPQGSDKQKDALQRSLQFFNCTYETAPLIMGLNAALEKENAESDEFDASTISGMKAALMGPASAIGDSLFWGIVRVVAASIAIPLAASGNILAPIVFLLMYHLVSIFVRYKLLDLGYTAGSSFMTSMLKGGMMEKLTFCISILGMIMIGAMAAQFVTVTTPMSFTFASGEKLVLADIFDKIFKGLLPLVFVFAYLALVRKKVKFHYITIGTLLFGIVGIILRLVQ